MSSSAALRPGIALGRYPQREDLRDGWLDRAAASLGGFVRQRAYGRRPGHEEFLASVRAGKGCRSFAGAFTAKVCRRNSWRTSLPSPARSPIAC